MDKETYDRTHYKGKHEQQVYTVWRVLSAIGPAETIKVVGLDAVKEAIQYCWDAEVHNERGELIHV